MGIFCPKTGGPAAINKIAKSFEGKVTYRYGSKGLPPAPGTSYVVKNKPVMCDGVPCASFCPEGSICIDCSGFVNHALACAGMKTLPGNGSTSAAFPDKSILIKKLEEKGDKVIINDSIELSPGDMVGSANNHIAIYIGGGYLAHSTSSNNGNNRNHNIQIVKFNKTLLQKSKKWLTHLRPYKTL